MLLIAIALLVDLRIFDVYCIEIDVGRNDVAVSPQGVSVNFTVPFFSVHR